MDVLQDTEANPLNGTQGLLDEQSIPQSTMFCSLHHLGKGIRNCRIVIHVNEIMQNFWLTLVSCKSILSLVILQRHIFGIVIIQSLYMKNIYFSSC